MKEGGRIHGGNRLDNKPEDYQTPDRAEEMMDYIEWEMDAPRIIKGGLITIIATVVKVDDFLSSKKKP